MERFRLLFTGAGKSPLFSAWLLFFVLVTTTALLLQLVVLTFWFPDLHAGNGLLVGGDWVGNWGGNVARLLRFGIFALSSVALAVSGRDVADSHVGMHNSFALQLRYA